MHTLPPGKGLSVGPRVCESVETVAYLAAATLVTGKQDFTLNVRKTRYSEPSRQAAFQSFST